VPATPNRAIPDPSLHSTSLRPDLACLSIQLRALPCSVPSISIRNTPSLRVLAPPVPSFPDRTFRRLPDLYSPCINLLLAVLTHLACWASRNPDVTHPSMPAMPHPPVPVIRHRIAPLPPARTFLSASLVACHHKPCPTQTLPVNLHSPFRACYPFLVGPLPDITCHSHPRLLIRACFVFNGDYSSPLRTSILESTPWFQVKNLNYWLLIAFLK